MVECNLPKVEVASSNLVSRSNKIKGLGNQPDPFFIAFISVASVFASVLHENSQETVCAILKKVEKIFRTKRRSGETPECLIPT